MKQYEPPKVTPLFAEDEVLSGVLTESPNQGNGDILLPEDDFLP